MSLQHLLGVVRRFPCENIACYLFSNSVVSNSNSNSTVSNGAGSSKQPCRNTLYSRFYRTCMEPACFSEGVSYIVLRQMGEEQRKVGRYGCRVIGHVGNQAKMTMNINMLCFSNAK